MRVFLAFFAAVLTGCAGTGVIVRAPLDGYVTAIQSAGAVLPGATSGAQVMFDELRTAQGMKRIYDVQRIGNNVARAAPLFHVTSDLLELQLEQERAKLKFASQKLDLAKGSLKLEAELKPIDSEREESRQVFTAYRVESEYLVQRQGRRDCKVCLGGAGADQLHHHGKSAAQKEKEGFLKRQSHQIDVDLPRKLSIAESELKAAHASVKIIEASIAVGQVTCPLKCRVVRLLVMPGQYVTRGDPVAEIEVQE